MLQPYMFGKYVLIFLLVISPTLTKALIKLTLFHLLNVQMTTLILSNEKSSTYFSNAWCSTTHLNVFRCFALMMSGISENKNAGWRRIFQTLQVWAQDAANSPNPTPSYCSRSRSKVCLMAASLAPWRRPCRPLIPFTNSICSNSESNLWRYLNTPSKHQVWNRLGQLQTIQAESGSLLLSVFFKF